MIECLNPRWFKFKKDRKGDVVLILNKDIKHESYTSFWWN